MVEPAELERLLVEAFPGARVNITDLTGTRDHYQVTIVAPAFEGCAKMRQHRMVYAALGDLMRGPIHALSLSTSAA
jgi:stress-induced morphogen